MSPITPLSRTYGVARNSFQSAAAFAGARQSALVHPLLGPDEEQLAIDIAELGPESATEVVLVVSGTHGVEGYCGSSLQREWLTHHGPERPDHVRVIMIHGFNPYGFAWVRRVNEDNVDLNRNFIDWSAPLPPSADYDLIAELLVPESWTPEEQERTTAALFEQAGIWGMERMQAAVSGGQYRHPAGVFYGGNGPVWSHRQLRSWAEQALVGVERLRIIDLHTGLGEWGHGELISHVSATDPEFQRAEALWGDVRSMVDGDSVSSALTGDWLGATQPLAPGAEITGAALEFGTVDTVTVLQALRADAWLHGYGNPRHPEAHQIRAQVRQAFADDDPVWITRCWERFASVMLAALQW